MRSTSAPRDLSREVILFLLPADVPEEYEASLKKRYPGITIRWQNMMSDSGPMRTSDHLPDELFRYVTILCTQGLPPAERLPHCHYIQLTSAGPDRALVHPFYQRPDVTFCAAHGVHPPQMAEWAIGAWIAHRHHFLMYAAQQQRGYWSSPHERSTAHVDDSAGSRMGILGYGAIGRQCARIAQAMGVDVLAYTSRERPTPESKKDQSYCLPGTGDPDGSIPSAWYFGTSKEAVNDFLAQDLDVLVMALPTTSFTRHILDSPQFEILSKKKTFIINVGRGLHINQDALISALESGKIKGAALDVADPEPLPKEHPLWKAPNCFLTPHVSWQTSHYFTRVMSILETNLDRLSRGEKLINQIDKALNY